MGHILDARIAIESRFATNYTSTPIHFWSANVPFKPTPGQSYVAISISYGDGRQITLGEIPQVHRYTGIIIVQIFTPEDKGAKASDDIADLVDPIFRRAQFSFGVSGVITCRTPVKEVVGVKDGWYQVNMKCLFKRDKQH